MTMIHSDDVAGTSPPDGTSVHTRPMSEELESMSLISLVSALLRHWRVFMGLPIAICAVALAIGFVTRTSTSRAAFLPESVGGATSYLAGLAALIQIAWELPFLRFANREYGFKMALYAWPALQVFHGAIFVGFTCGVWHILAMPFERPQAERSPAN